MPSRRSLRLRRLTRSPLVFWPATAALAVVTAMTVSHMLGRAAAEAARYGSLRRAVFVARSVGVGEEITEDDVEVRTVPAAFLPRGSIAVVPIGRTVISPLFAGQALDRGQLAPEGLHGVAALTPVGRRAIAIPRGDETPPLRLGDLVDVLATFDPSSTSGGDPTFAVARSASVVAVDNRAVTVAVSTQEAPRVAFALAGASVTVAVLRPGATTPTE